MAGESCSLSLCVHSAELDSSTHDAYCKLYLDSHDLTGGTGLGSGNNHHHSNAAESPSPLDDHREDGPRSFHTQPDRSAKKTSSPLWNETFTAEVFDRRNEILTIRVKSKKLLHVSAVGACAIPLRQIPVGRPVDQWFPLQKGNKRRGKIRLQLMLTYTSAPLSATTTAPTASSWSSTPSSPDAPANYQYQPRSSVDRRRSTGPRRSSLEPATPPISAGRMSSSSSLSRASISSSSGPKQHQWQTIGSAPSSSITSPPLNASAPPPSVPSSRPLYQPEEEPVKASIPSPKKPAPQPRPVLTSMESDDDEDEAGFPRVAELHRLESDLIGEYSDDEGGHGSVLESKASTYSLKMEAVVEESAKQLTSGLTSDVEIARQTINQHVAHEELRRLEELRSPVNRNGDVDGRSSIEVSRETRVAVAPSEIAKLAAAPLSAHIDEYVESDNEEENDTHIAVSSNSVKRENGGTEIWNRYPSSSSSEELDLQLPYPDERLSDVEVPPKEEAHHHSDANEAAVEAGAVNPFVEPASPSDSDGEGHVDTDAVAHTPSDEHDREHPHEAAVVVGSAEEEEDDEVVVGIAVEVEDDLDVAYAISVSSDSEHAHDDAVVAVETTETESGARHSTSSSSSRSSSKSIHEDATPMESTSAEVVAFETAEVVAQATSAAAVDMQQHDVDVRSEKSASVSASASSLHAAHSFISEDVQHSFVSEMPEHSFVSEQANHSFVSEQANHSFVSEQADHSFVSEMLDHSFVSETADHSFVSEQPDHSFVSDDPGHSFVSDEPGHSFVSDDPGHSFVSERPTYLGENRRHSFISASAVISQSASITEEPRHSFIAEEPSHSFVSESSAHSFISESPQHSFVSDDPGHSFVSERPTGDSFVATSAPSARHTHSFVSEDGDHSFVSDDPGHSFISERPGQSVVSEADVVALSTKISEGDAATRRESSSSSSDDDAPAYSASSFIEELVVDAVTTAEQVRDSLSSEEDAEEELSLVGVYHEDATITHSTADTEVVSTAAPVDMAERVSVSSSSSSSSSDRAAASSFIEEFADDENAVRPSVASSYAAPGEPTLSPRASILSSEGVRDSDVQELRMSERISFPSSPRSSSASFSQVGDITAVTSSVVATEATTEIERSSVVSSALSSSSSEAAEEEHFTQHLEDGEVDVRYSTVSSVTTNGHEDPTLSHTWIDEPSTNVELLDLLRRVSRASDADDLSPPSRPVDAPVAVVEPIAEFMERSEPLTSTLLSTGEPERDPEEIAQALAQAIAAAQQEHSVEAEVMEESESHGRSRASSSSSSSDDEEALVEEATVPEPVVEAPITITVNPKVMVVQPTLSLSSMDMGDSVSDAAEAEEKVSPPVSQSSPGPEPVRVDEPEPKATNRDSRPSSDPEAVGVDETEASIERPTAADRPVLRHMSTTLTATQLESAAVDCLPSDSDDSSVCGSDDEFNFDSDSD
ncbi:hypothetical protein P43SY_000507 [Pythium insidiosum]|uniref:C2 domain-containing protein n=1 Tax=Pythium insidiosum TaxID=114742 RepID=A0AAD5QCX3_PYTIN|nr:hypothetical protein P43SY_000507 [Pythium insidiosum]